MKKLKLLSLLVFAFGLFSQAVYAQTISPVVTTVSGDSFRVDIQVSGVTDLFGISFNLVYTADSPDVLALGVETDPFIGTDLIFLPTIDNSAKTVSVGISRKAGQGGVSGDGTVAQIYFQGNVKAPVGTSVGLELQEVTANDPSGNAITFTVENGDFVTDIESLTEGSGRIPEAFELFQNYPNPFNPVTSINFQIPKRSHVVLKIYDILGREVRTLLDEGKPAGVYKIVWDGGDDRGVLLSSGVYFYGLRTDEFTSVRKMLFVR